jgi:Transposase IS66 family/zinc-finger binding domain of transposase IS66
LYSNSVLWGMISQTPIPASLWNTVPPKAQAAVSALVGSLEQRMAELEAENAELRRRLEQLEHELQKIHQRKKHPQNGRIDPKVPRTDRRRKEHRKHPGTFRPEPPPGTEFTEHDVRPQQCSHCGATDLEPTGQFEDHFVADIPEPKIEWHRYRRHVYRCRCCEQTCQGRGDLELPGSHIGPRARLLTCYSRAHLGISLGKTQNLLHDFFGLTVSRAGLLGHLHWGGQLFAPVVEELLELLRQSPVVQGDETGWRINGKTAWAWCFRDPRLALFLIDRHRSRDVIVRVLGESFAGTLVSDFYAAYNGLDCAKQRCLVHLLRELAKLREELPWQSVRAFIQPLIDLFRDAIQLGKDREKLGHAAFHEAYKLIIDRFDDLMLKTQTRHPDCLRIWKRLYKHCDELFTFLDDSRVPADNNGTERDIRSLAAARSDGGTHRTDWSAAAFARIKSIIVTSMKNGVRFIEYGTEVVRAKLRGERLPLPLAATTDTS